MKITILCPGVGGGGSERVAVILHNYLSEKGHSVNFIVQRITNHSYMPTQKSSVIAFKSNNTILRALELVEHMNNLKSDVYISVGQHTNIVLLLANFLARQKIIISERNAFAYHSMASADSGFFRKAAPLMYVFANKVVFQTKAQQSCYGRRVLHKSVIIQNPVVELPKTESEFRKNQIVAVGRLEPLKNYPLLLKASALVMEKHKNFSLHIYGEGASLRGLIKLALELGIGDSVVFEGRRDDVHERIAQAQVFVMPSICEGMPNALLEAMALGLPCIVADFKGVEDIVTDGINGLIVEQGNERKLADAICRIIEDSGLAERLSARAMEIRETNKRESICAKWEKLIYDIVK